MISINTENMTSTGAKVAALLNNGSLERRGSEILGNDSGCLSKIDEAEGVVAYVFAPGTYDEVIFVSSKFGLSIDNRYVSETEFWAEFWDYAPNQSAGAILTR